ncbi:MAG TPA: TIGR01777 family oxidoreductase [Candidatus Sulfopaludibacter sp.]|nr:TIGR01777 family oxidoreductase [Candidatus Sulfopaludibacter sp.]
MKITISGASGLIGRRLLKALSGNGHTLQVLSRHAGTNMPGGVKVFPWDPSKAEPPDESLRDADAVIHLAGEPVAQRWTDHAKRRIRDSRVVGTRNLVQAIGKLTGKPSVLVCSSAIGYYGSRGDEMLPESAGPGNGFLADLCVAWEKEAAAAEALGMRVVSVRTGLVLDKRGGALARMLPPFKMGAGGRLGNGQQWQSWIHLDDLVGLYRLALETPLKGAINGVAPYPVTNADFTKALASALHRPAVFPVPSFGLKLLFGEMAEVLLASQRVQPKQAEAAGYRFKFPQLEPALADLLK